MTQPPKTIQIWHTLVQSMDPKGLDPLLADDVVFHSPVMHAPQPGKELVKMYLTAAFHVLGIANFQYVREIVGETDAALEFTAEINGTEINGVDFIHWNAENKITDFKVMIRPLNAINLVRRLMRERLVQLARDARVDQQLNTE